MSDTWAGRGGPSCPAWAFDCAASALYASAAQVISESWGRYLMPLGLVEA